MMYWCSVVFPRTILSLGSRCKIPSNLLSTTSLRRLCTKKTTMLDLTGIYPPIPTPFNNQEDIAWEELDYNINRWEASMFKGYVVLGSNGEFPYLTTEEKVRMIKETKEKASSDKLVIAGAGCESTRETIIMCKYAQDAGADAVLIHTPCFFKSKMTNSALLNHYIQVANNSPVPVILYSVPANTGVDLPAEVAIELAKHNNIIGIKDSGGDISKICLMVNETKDDEFQILAGSAGFLLPALRVGCVGGVCALANVCGDAVVRLMNLHESNELHEANELQAKLIKPNAAVTRLFGVPGLKYMMEKRGFYGGPVRSPLQPLIDQEKYALKDIFENAGDALN